MRVGSVALVAALLVSACSPGLSPTPSDPGARPSPSASHPPTASAVAPSPSPAAALDVHLIPQSWTTPLLATSTDGSEIVWSKGGDTQHGAPDLYSYRPGASGPTLIYRGPDRTGQLIPIAVHHGKYAFSETYERSDNSAGRRVWYVPAAGQPAILLDSNDKDPHELAAPPEWIALTDARVIWTAVHQTPSGPHYYLYAYEVATGMKRILGEADAARTEYWFPNADDSGRLVYGTVETSGNGEVAFHVYLVRFGDNPFQPRRLDTDGDAAEPVLSGDTVIWKSVTSENVVNWGLLNRYSLSTREVKQIFFANQAFENDATAGDRFLAAWLPDDTIFELYDLQTDTMLLVEQYDPTGPLGVVRPVVAGDLVVFIRIDTTPGKDLQLCWARLPAAG